MRLFTAIELPEAERRRLASLRSLGREADSFTPVREQSLHLTLKFLGEVADDQLPAICDALRQIEPTGPMDLRVAGVTFFPERGPVRVFVAGVVGDVERLNQLFARIELALQPLGFAPERRRFNPHVTLARVRHGRRVSGGIRKLVGQQPLPPGEPFRVDSFTLFQSNLNPTGAQYVPLAHFPLAPVQ